MADAIEMVAAAFSGAERRAPSIGSRGWGWEAAGSGPIFFSQGPFQTDQGSHSLPVTHVVAEWNQVLKSADIQWDIGEMSIHCLGLIQKMTYRNPGVPWWFMI